MANGKLDAGAQRHFKADELRICDLQLNPETPGLFRPDPANRCLQAARLDREAVRKCVDRPEIDAVLAATSKSGAQGYKLITAAQVGPSHGHAAASAGDRY
jgi:hypothetical protein